MYTTKYRPTNLDNFIGNKLIVQQLIKWLLNWNTNDKCALISGPNGIGKSLLVELVSYKHDYNLIEFSGDDALTKNIFETTIKPLIKSKKTFNDQENVLLFSDIDTISDYGFISSLTEIMKSSEIPIICICDNRYDQSIKPILNYCTDFKMTPPKYDDIYPLIYNIVINENIKIGIKGVKNLYENSNGDIRFILNSLQLNIKKTETKCEKETKETYKNIQNLNIFDTTGKLLNMDLTLNDKYNLYWMAQDIHSLMIQENYINSTLNCKNEVTKFDNMSYSADALSDTDLYDMNIQNTLNWEMEKFIATSTIQATTKCNKKGLIKFPSFLGNTTKMYRNKREKYDHETMKFIEIIQQQSLTMSNDKNVKKRGTTKANGLKNKKK